MSILLATLLLAGTPPALRVKGTTIVTDRRVPVSLRGVNIASLEWSVDGEGHILKTARVAVEDWKANILRIPLSQDRWFGKTEGQTDGGAAYRSLVGKTVDEINSRGAYALLDLHWNDAGEWGKNIGQHNMPDMYSIEFWKSCAHDYKNKPGVLFDLYNETHDITWELWKNGGEVEERRRVGAGQGTFTPVKYQAPGMQTMLDTIRAQGANNVVVVGGLDWAYDLSGFLKGFALTDSKKGRGLIYACHAYNNKGDSVPTFLRKLDAALPTLPVIVSEFGDQARGAARNEPTFWLTVVLTALEERRCNWIAWDLHPAAGPTLISDWNYTPTPSFGVPVKAALSNF
jgi:endoglucanase